MKHLVVTGASSGFGREFIRRFLRDPEWIVHATSRNGSLEQIDRLNEDERHRLKVYPLDLAKADQIREFRSRLLRQTQTLDVLINNAGIGIFGALEDLSEEQIRQQMEVNFFGTVMLSRELLPTLKASRGRIFNLSSMLGFTGLPYTSLYCASKFAIEGWSESMALELAPHGVGVTMLEPGCHRTNFGSNSKWAVSTTPTADGYQRFMHGVLNYARAPKPENIANSVFRMISRGRCPYRVRFGFDSQFSYWARRVLPLSLVISVTGFALNRIFRSLARRSK